MVIHTIMLSYVQYTEYWYSAYSVSWVESYNPPALLVIRSKEYRFPSNKLQIEMTIVNLRLTHKQILMVILYRKWCLISYVYFINKKIIILPSTTWIFCVEYVLISFRHKSDAEMIHAFYLAISYMLYLI